VEHRGRFQAQGHGLELSVGWDQEVALSATSAHQLVSTLEQRLLRRERKLRAGAFMKLHIWIDRAAAAGGVDAPQSKTFLAGHGRRVDVEVNAGRAFVP
jgi:hypothetical protein